FRWYVRHLLGRSGGRQVPPRGRVHTRLPAPPRGVPARLATAAGVHRQGAPPAFLGRRRSRRLSRRDAVAEGTATRTAYPGHQPAQPRRRVIPAFPTEGTRTPKR